ncbi:MAG: hypothetical protein UT48_C0003G0006 [Parcubacteria group bacterium GW2011_GWE2_39_37]|uniref:DUF2304 domain-containing protein n=1 Tax=Candidatus Falkowbacteria bacterium GW2011_GWF2_39_8 TaxID=1618642 RepID=A0A0G0S970_9BACT|nr:MAG: hypothetical protein UT48_C0003G0006 [Parcubacteria group bacterium GW2011_GWE2_39_37]KKR31290.1 MAG: hypothetical protein UT64_C0066G0003 [Candidatus Falkowbacteria bacterium GW2011_GWF2_39_8]
MFQQISALVIILFFISRLIWQKKNNQIANNEFKFWLFFWLVAGLAVLSLKWVDQIVAKLGFSGSGIEVLLYVSTAVMFYLIFRLRLRLTKIEQSITKIVTEIALDNKK